MKPNDQISNGASVSRKKREGDFRRKLVLEAAEALFAEKGYDRTTVADIAARAELAKGSLYQLFESKEDVFTALIEEKLESALRAIDLALAGDESPIEKIRKVIRDKLQHFWAHRDFARIFMNEFKGYHMMMDPAMAERHERGAIAFQEKVEGIIAEGQRLGELRSDVSSAILMAALSGFTNGIIVRWLKDPGSIDYEEAARKVEEVFLHGASTEKT
jgi:AcrR family transcriptional regulator